MAISSQRSVISEIAYERQENRERGGNIQAKTLDLTVCIGHWLIFLFQYVSILDVAFSITTSLFYFQLLRFISERNHEL